jgi:hypothetical protein
MAKLRTVYDIYQIGEPLPDEEYIETLEFETPQLLEEYLLRLRDVTKRDYTGRLAVLLVRDKKGKVHERRG